MNEDAADDKMFVFAMILTTLINLVYEDLYDYRARPCVSCFGPCASERLNCVARRGWVDLVSENIWA